MFKNIVYQHICEFLVTNTEVNPSLYSCKNTGESLHVYTYSKKNYEWIICIDIQTDPFFLINSFCHALSKLKRLMSIRFTLNLKPQIFNIFFFIAILESKKNTLFLKYHFWTGRDLDYVILELTWDFWLSLWLSWYTNVVVTYFHTTVRKPDDSIITSLDVSLKQNDHLILILEIPYSSMRNPCHRQYFPLFLILNDCFKWSSSLKFCTMSINCMALPWVHF